MAEARVFPLTRPYPIMPVGVVAGKLMIDGGCRQKRKDADDYLKTSIFLHKNRVRNA